MTLDDVRGIYNGPDDAATRYFEGTMSGPLSEEFTPLVRESLADVGAVRAYEDLMSGISSFRLFRMPGRIFLSTLWIIP